MVTFNANQKFCTGCGNQINARAAICPACGVRQTFLDSKSRTTAAVLALLLGGVGVHRFYLGQAGLGIVYLLFCWTFIPAIIAFIDFLVFISQSDETFHLKYN